MIAERTLKKWRKEALAVIKEDQEYPNPANSYLVPGAKIILQMTQELLDQHPLRREK